MTCLPIICTVWLRTESSNDCKIHCIGLQCIVKIEILFNHLSLKLSDFQSSRNLPSFLTSIILYPTKYQKLCPGNKATISTVPCVQPKASSVQLRKYSQAIAMILLIKSLLLLIFPSLMEWLWSYSSQRRPLLALMWMEQH